MKKILIIIISLILVGCVSKKELYQTKELTTDIIEIESCEYILIYQYYGTAITHKGNCKNIIHNYNIEVLE